MEHLPFIIMLVLAAFLCFLLFSLDEKIYVERTRRQALQEREAIACRLLFALWSKYTLDTDGTYINKNDMLPQLTTALMVIGNQHLPEKKAENDMASWPAFKKTMQRGASSAK